MKDPLQNVHIVLVRPQSAGNIGSACRAMKNMGLSNLIVVAPEEDPFSPDARMMATSAKDLLEKAKIFPTFDEALAGFRWIAATSARKGKNRGPFISPREISPEIIDHARSIPVAILFGPEDRGLKNEDLAPCQALISIPTHRGLSSLNLAQAVMLVGYELHLASLSGMRNESKMPNAELRIRNEEGRGTAASGIRRRRAAGFAPCPGSLAPLAEFQKLEKMYAQMEEFLLRIGFLNPKNPKRIMHTLRRIFGRARLSDRDVAIVRGIFRQLEWYATHYDPSKERKQP